MIQSAKALAADASNAILAKNQANTTPTPMNAAYKAAVARMYEHAETLIKTSDAAANYAAARMKAHEASVRVPQK